MIPDAIKACLLLVCYEQAGWNAEDGLVFHGGIILLGPSKLGRKPGFRGCSFYFIYENDVVAVFGSFGNFRFLSKKLGVAKIKLERAGRSVGCFCFYSFQSIKGQL